MHDVTEVSVPLLLSIVRARASWALLQFGDQSGYGGEGGGHFRSRVRPKKCRGIKIKTKLQGVQFFVNRCSLISGGKSPWLLTADRSCPTGTAKSLEELDPPPPSRFFRFSRGKSCGTSIPVFPERGTIAVMTHPLPPPGGSPLVREFEAYLARAASFGS